MDDTGAFEALVEFAIALAGFTGVVVVFRRREGRLHPADEIRVFMALLPTLACAFLALLPVGLGMLGLAPARVWLVSGIAFAAAVAAILSAISFRVSRLPQEVRGVLSRPLSVLFYLLVGSMALTNLLSATVVIGLPPAGSYFFALLTLLVVGATVFARIVFIRPSA